MTRNNKKRYEKDYSDAIVAAQQRGAPDHRFVGNMLDGEVQYFDKQPLRIRTTPICWGIPMDEYLYAKFMVYIFRHGRPMPWDTFATTESTYLPDARNNIHNMFLKSEFPYLMMLDSDVLIPDLLVERLIAHRKPIVGGWYANKNRLKAYTPHPIVYDYIGVNDKGHVLWNHREKPGEGVEQVDGMGAGCWLMDRQTALALGESPYDMAGGTEDLKLSKKLLDLGIPMFVDWSLHCPHVGVSWV